MQTKKMGLFSTIPKLIKAVQVSKVQEICDLKTGERFLAQIGDWKVQDENGNVFVLNYYEFLQRYMPANEIAFEMFTKKEQIYALKGQLFQELKSNIKNNFNRE